MILLTGFESWSEVPENPTSSLVEELTSDSVVGEVLPVSFKRAGERLEELIGELRPSVVLNLGLAPGIAVVKMERVAINLIDAKVPDNDGYKPVDEPIDREGPLCYFSTLPTREIVNALRSEGIPAVLSYSAGTFLCNYVMYKTLRTLDLLGIKAVAGFMHVPYSSEIVSKIEKSIPSLPFSALRRSVEVALRSISRC